MQRRKAECAMSAEELARLVDESGFVFKGRVVSPQRAETSTETGLAAITVEVEDVLSGTDILRSLVGTEVTVVQERGPSAGGGDLRAFLTYVVCLGTGAGGRGVA